MRSLLLVCLVSSLFGQSAQSPPQRKEPAKDEGREVAAKKNDGQNLPSGAGSSKGQFNTADQNQKSDTSNQGGKTDLDGWMIGLTAGLVLVGAGQVWVLVRQTSILDRGLAETRTATVLTRKSLVLTQRPRLTIRNIVLDEPNYSLRFLAPTSKDPTFMPAKLSRETCRWRTPGTAKLSSVTPTSVLPIGGNPSVCLCDGPTMPTRGASCARMG